MNITMNGRKKTRSYIRVINVASSGVVHVSHRLV